MADRQVFSVSELTREIKKILEKKYAFVWICGEISNISKAASGHLYLTLKDRNAQIAGVIFKAQARLLREPLRNGMQVTGLGRVSVYEPRGTYQIILEYLEPSGIGKLLAELEALKSKLKAEGLFDSEYKKELPFLPSKIAVITSPTGAAIEDILNIAERRFENIPIEIVPVSVQGENSADEIVRALGLVNSRASAEVVVLARGGGSVEDLQPFNSERVARAIFQSSIPVVSAVGHETDYTIADFVSDLRAPTPSAAVEMILPVREDLRQAVKALHQRITAGMHRLVDSHQGRLAELTLRLMHPRKKFDDANLRLDELRDRLERAVWTQVDQRRLQLNWQRERVLAWRPDQRINQLNEKINDFTGRLAKLGVAIVERRRQRLEVCHGMLAALNPKAILQRGYSITRTLPEQEVVRDADCVNQGELLEILLGKGTLKVKNISQN